MHSTARMRPLPTRENAGHFLVRRSLARLITLYQRYVSPYKGYRCAHKALHGGPSCSAHIKASLLTRGPWAAFSDARIRFAACYAASHELRIQMTDRPMGRETPGREPGKETPEERTKRCAIFTPATCCLTGFMPP